MKNKINYAESLGMKMCCFYFLFCVEGGICFWGVGGD